ncbi:MAG: NlpC/P60 family protein [Flavobacteriia bacterium]|jgi:cell wall-associated NlpC family hydrolase
MSSKSAYCFVSISPVRSENRDASEMVTQLLFGELVTIEEIAAPWCRIRTFSDNYEGFCDIKHLRFLSEKEVTRWMDGLSYQKELAKNIETPWGKQTIFRGSYLPFEVTDTFNIGNDHFAISNSDTTPKWKSVTELAKEYLNTPYLWGGKSPFGIDCSGLTQVCLRFFEINLPRDASQQIEYGSSVEFDEIISGDLAFFSNNSGKIIHVGICDGLGNIIHASGMVRMDQLSNDGIINSETGQQTHSLHSIRRM